MTTFAEPGVRPGPVQGTHAAHDVLLTAVAITAILCLRLPAAFGATPPTWINLLSLAPIAVGVLVLAPRLGPMWPPTPLIALLGLFVAITSVALYRGAAAGAFETINHSVTEIVGLLLITTFAFMYCASARDRVELLFRVRLLLYAPGLYVVANVAAHLGGLHVATVAGEPASVSNVGQPAELLALLGIHAGRVLFPLANGINNFGDVVGCALVAAAVLVVTDRGKWRRLDMAVVLCSLFALFATDSRGALLFAVAAVIISLALATNAGLVALPAAVPFTTAIATAVLGFTANTGLVSLFSRNNLDLATGTNRLYIWRAILPILSHPSFSQIYGYGANGQIASGASLRYDYLFAGVTNPAQLTTHNFMLQMVLDSGYLGLACMVALLMAAFARLRRAGPVLDRAIQRALIGILIFLILVGATDGAPSVYTPEALDMFLVVAAVAASTAFLPWHSHRGPTPKAVAQ